MIDFSLAFSHCSRRSDCECRALFASHSFGLWPPILASRLRVRVHSFACLAPISLPSPSLFFRLSQVFFKHLRPFTILSTGPLTPSEHDYRSHIRDLGVIQRGFIYPLSTALGGTVPPLSGPG